ncbi:hypothetical protein IPC288_31155 [Pseudomonas aeruginosa]|nr:hypothetical protein IPC288_31155 [Pseudomonas aeruginosa]
MTIRATRPGRLIGTRRGARDTSAWVRKRVINSGCSITLRGAHYGLIRSSLVGELLWKDFPNLFAGKAHKCSASIRADTAYKSGLAITILNFRLT